VHFFGLFLSSLLKIYGPKNKKDVGIVHCICRIEDNNTSKIQNDMLKRIIDKF